MKQQNSSTIPDMSLSEFEFSSGDWELADWQVEMVKNTQRLIREGKMKMHPHEVVVKWFKNLPR